MAIEIANIIHAAALFSADDPPVLHRGIGLRAVTPLERFAAGNYRVHLAQEILNDLAVPDVQGGCLATIFNPGLNTVIGVAAAILAPNNGYVTVLTRDAGGLAADGSIIQLVVFRWPTIN